MSMDQQIRTVGVPVESRSVRRPERLTYEGRFVTLEPLALKHAEALWANTKGPERDPIWDYMPDGPFADEATFQAFIHTKSGSADPMFWAILDRASGEAQGYATLMRIEPTHRVIEVGNILFSPAMQRTPGATEAMYLLARIVFDDLGYRRYEWKCNALNAPSRAAAARLGFTFEGIFRQHMIVKGRNRDTAWFSMLDTEWPACRAAFEHWLAPENFDQWGKQRQSLASLRGQNAATPTV
jgi:RimJ/RimL family protein N-acetyltransferase